MPVRLFPGMVSATVSIAVSLIGSPLGAEQLTLGENWRVQDAAKISLAGDALSLPGASTDGWYVAAVPSTVAAVLLANGVYPDPYFGANIKSWPGTAFPLERNFSNLPMPADSPFRRPWWYRTEFRGPQTDGDRRVWLRFDGINYRANIWMNGRRIARSAQVAGVYRQFEFDVTELVRPSAPNAVAVEVFAPEPKDLGITWVDWNPSPPDKNMGLWSDVTVATSGPIALRHPQVVTAVQSLDAADLTVIVEAINAIDRPLDARIRGSIEQIGFEKTIHLPAKGRASVRIDSHDAPGLHMAHPRLWWPHTMGIPNLYELRLAALVDGALSDEISTRFGMRHITSEITPDGCRLFRVNGRSILIRGGGWASDMLLRRDPSRLEAELRYVKEMNLNAVRLEGKLESETFFDITDREGILVMAGWCCCDQWEKWKGWTAENRAVSVASARDQMLRLRGRPSLLAWLNGSDNHPPPDVERAYLDVERETGWPNPIVSSATAQSSDVSGPSGVKMNGPYDFVPPSYWLQDSRRGGAFCFNTETSPGPAIPPVESLREMFPADRLWPPNELWTLHAGGGQFRNLELYTQALDARYGKAKNIDDFVWKSQAMAYDGERAMFEAFGRNKYRATGIIQWMLNNAWPSLIWHLYDHRLRPAGGYYGTKKANAALHVLYSYDDRSIALVSDLPDARTGLTVSTTVYDFHLQPRFSKDARIDVPADSTVRAFVVPDLPISTTTYFLRLRLRDEHGATVDSNFYWLSTRPDALDWAKSTWYHTPVSEHADLRTLESLPPATIDVLRFAEDDDGAERRAHVTLHNPGSSLAFLVRAMLIDGPGGGEILPSWWSDNYIEIFPGESRELSVSYRARDRRTTGAAGLRIDGWNVSRFDWALDRGPH